MTSGTALLAVLARSADASEPLSVFCQAAAQETARGFTAVSIVLLDGLKTVAAVGAWPESLSALAIWQFQERHGPCYDACSAEGTVTATDLSGAGVRRWPLWAPAAAALGLGAVSSQPLRRNGQVIGSLLLGTADDEPLEPAMLPDIGSAARVAVELAMTRRDLDDAHLRAAQLQRALDSRVVVEQAKGRLSVEFGCTVDEAFEWLRRHARSTNRKLHDLATEVVDGRLPTDMLRAASKNPWPGSGTLTIELTAHGLRLAGHADPIDVDAVAARMRVAAAASTRVVVDLSQLEGCDAAVAQALIDEQRSARPRTRVVLDSPRAPVATLLSALKASERPGITIRQAAKP